MILLLAGVAAFVGYCLGYVRASQNSYGFSVSTSRPATQEELYQGGDTRRAQEAEAAEEDLALPGQEPDQETAEEEPAARIDLNHADAETLQQLPGIGPKRAEAIIRYREEYGIFTTTHEITKVPGIGEELYEQIKDLVTVEYRDLSP